MARCVNVDHAGTPTANNGRRPVGRPPPARPGARPRREGPGPPLCRPRAAAALAQMRARRRPAPQVHVTERATRPRRIRQPLHRIRQPSHVTSGSRIRQPFTNWRGDAARHARARGERVGRGTRRRRPRRQPGSWPVTRGSHPRLWAGVHAPGPSGDMGLWCLGCCVAARVAGGRAGIYNTVQWMGPGWPGARCGGGAAWGAPQGRRRRGRVPRAWGGRRHLMRRRRPGPQGGQQAPARGSAAAAPAGGAPRLGGCCAAVAWVKAPAAAARGEERAPIRGAAAAAGRPALGPSPGAAGLGSRSGKRAGPARGACGLDCRSRRLLAAAGRSRSARRLRKARGAFFHAAASKHTKAHAFRYALRREFEFGKLV